MIVTQKMRKVYLKMADPFLEDGKHASEAGSDFAAKYIWETIFMDINRHE